MGTKVIIYLDRFIVNCYEADPLQNLWSERMSFFGRRDFQLL